MSLWKIYQRVIGRVIKGEFYMDRIFKEIFTYLQGKEMYYEGLLCTNARLNLTSEQERSAEKCLNLVKDITSKIHTILHNTKKDTSLEQMFNGYINDWNAIARLANDNVICEEKTKELNSDLLQKIIGSFESLAKKE